MEIRINKHDQLQASSFDIFFMMDNGTVSAIHGHFMHSNCVHLCDYSINDLKLPWLNNRINSSKLVKLIPNEFINALNKTINA